MKNSLYKQQNIMYNNRRQTFFETLIAGGGETINRQLSNGGSCCGY